jgi:hypothetical protein
MWRLGQEILRNNGTNIIITGQKKKQKGKNQKTYGKKTMSKNRTRQHKMVKIHINLQLNPYQNAPFGMVFVVYII